MRVLTGVMLMGAFCGSGLTARADTIVFGGGTTTVNLDAAVVSVLTGAGLSLSALGSGSIAGTSVTFPITGGSLDTDSSMAMLFHNGSGLRFSSASAFLDLTDFIINANVTPGSESGTLTGDLMGAVTASNFPLFSIGPGLELALTSETASGLSAVFGLPDLKATVIGTAAVNPTAIPEPSTFAFLIVGVGFGAAVRLRFRVSG